MNNVVLVGRLTRDITVNKSDKGSKVATITLAVPRSFKNMEGNYDTDFIDCVAFDMIAENTKEYCSKGDIIGVKGRIQSRKYQKKVDENTKRIDELFDKFDPKDIVKDYIFFEGEFYDAYSILLDILNQSKEEVIIID